ncbi:type III endosome membrane protein TEMP isoform X2 [Vombatus ursinus]|uniref:type III endosome membrane protein TEMP isoform X2 n=1 Tax=Vombatus ursinus TaxID=29139 RepID=UPI000FFD910B|nr:type III endosome membrane protein TEMP isoform X2 [Vombatus ursinus]
MNRNHQPPSSRGLQAFPTNTAPPTAIGPSHLTSFSFGGMDGIFCPAHMCPRPSMSQVRPRPPGPGRPRPSGPGTLPPLPVGPGSLAQEPQVQLCGGGKEIRVLFGSGLCEEPERVPILQTWRFSFLSASWDSFIAVGQRAA